MAEGPAGQRFSTAPGADGDHVTYCRICEALCGMVATVEGGRVVRIRPDAQNPHSRGQLCVKGPAIADVTNDADRVVHPLGRASPGAELAPVAWDEALDDIAARLSRVLEAHGPDALGVVYGNPPSFGMSSVMAPALFQRAVGARKAFSPQTEDTAATLLAQQVLFGTTSYAFPDLSACDHLLIFGSNPLVSHGSLMIAPRIREDLATIAARGRVIVVDPRRTETARRFEYVPILPATDVWLLAAMLGVIASEGFVDREFAAAWTTGCAQLLEALAPITPERAREHCGIAPSRIRELALDFARAPRAAAMGRLGLCRGTFPTLSNVLLNALNVIAGKFHKPGCSGFGHGATSSGDMLAAAGMAGYAPGASRTSGLPAVVGSLPSVTLRDEMTQPGTGRIRALIVSGSNPVLSMPGGARLHEGFAQLELMVCLDLYLTETSRYADYVLPATTFLERDDAPILFGGHMVRPFMQFAPAVLHPRGEAREELAILAAIAERMGRGLPFGGATPLEAVDALLRDGPEGERGGEGSARLSIARLREHPHGILLERGRWAFALEQKLGHPDRRIHLYEPLIASEVKRLLATPVDRSGKLRLFSMRKLRSINSWMHNVDALVRSDSARLYIHPDDALARRIRDGDEVRVATREGSVDVTAHVTDEVVRGSVSYPHGWGHAGGWRRANATRGANINAIAPASAEAVEQISGMSFLDGFPVDVERIAR
jgi:formate dehydrogenase